MAAKSVEPAVTKAFGCEPDLQGPLIFDTHAQTRTTGVRVLFAVLEMNYSEYCESKCSFNTCMYLQLKLNYNFDQYLGGKFGKLSYS